MKYLFKGIEKGSDKWAVGGYVSDAETGRHYIVTANGYEHEGAKLIEVKAETLCMSTGLFDREGKLVFENDVLKGQVFGDKGNEMERYLKLVSFRDGLFYVLPDPYVGDNIRDFLSPIQADAEKKAKCVVVANIHDADYHESRKGALL